MQGWAARGAAREKFSRAGAGTASRVVAAAAAEKGRDKHMKQLNKHVKQKLYPHLTRSFALWEERLSYDIIMWL